MRPPPRGAARTTTATVAPAAACGETPSATRSEPEAARPVGCGRRRWRPRRRHRPRQRGPARSRRGDGHRPRLRQRSRASRRPATLPYPRRRFDRARSPNGRPRSDYAHRPTEFWTLQALLPGGLEPKREARRARRGEVASSTARATRRASVTEAPICSTRPWCRASSVASPRLSTRSPKAAS